MDNTEYFKAIRPTGYVMLSYAMLKILNLKTAIVFERINTEYGNAKRNNYLIEDYCFGYNEAEIADSINFTVDDVKTAIDELEKLNFIKTMVVKPVKLLHINISDICNYLEAKQKNNKFNNWDYGLHPIQYGAFTMLSFDTGSINSINNIKQIKEIEDDPNAMATDENGNPLMF